MFIVSNKYTKRKYICTQFALGLTIKLLWTNDQ